ncbi:hypothetical protein B0T19DRAFT_469192 [Cercophora scortea]|uniref:DUF6604 domain-containing protein n=1 Tax=Cercophora scortea TaxID=314031 RepID=A0AAE0M379_9PEZI|nr:hypothetical protein B0T19DRAFT_469192 [Cercophora scortea]
MESRPAGLQAGMSTWHRYKLGQAQFTNWARITAAKVEAALPPAKPEQDGNGFSSGDGVVRETERKLSRREAKKAKKAANDHNGVKHQQTSTAGLPPWLAELETMTETITTHIDPHDIPESPINILRDVVALRKKSARFFSAAASRSEDVNLQQSNAAHLQIIAVLDGILAKFEALLTKVKREPSSLQSDTPGLGVSAYDLSNIFSYLEVDETAAVTSEEESEVEEHKHGIAKKKHTKRARKANKKSKQTPPAKSTKGQGSSAGVNVDDKYKRRRAWIERWQEKLVNGYLQIYCLFEDFNTIRDYIVERWCDYFYQDRPIGVDTLAVLTNAAFELFYQLEEETSKNAKFSKDFCNVLKNLVWYFSLEEMNGKKDLSSKQGPRSTKTADLDEKLDVLFGGNDEDPTDEDLEGTFHRLGLRTFFHLEALMQHQYADPVKIQIALKQDDKTSQYGLTSIKERHDLAYVLTNELLEELNVIRNTKINVDADYLLPAETELALGLQDMLRKVDGDRVSVAVVLSLQLWNDIRQTIETKVTDACTIMQSKAREVKARLESMLPSTENGPSPLARYSMPLRQRIVEIESFMLRDVTHYEKKMLAGGLEGIDLDTLHVEIEPFQLLNSEPVWAGLLLLRARLVASHLGYLLTRHSYVIEAAACLYAVAKLRGDPRLPSWPLMDKWMATTYAEDSAFKRALGQATPALIVSEFSTTFPGIMTGQKPIDATDEHEYAPQIAMRKALVERYADNRRDCHGFLEYLEKLTRAKHNLTLQRSPNTSGNTPPVTNTSTQRSPIQTLELVDEILTNDLDDILDLDYAELSKQCTQLLYRVCLDPTFRDSELQEALPRQMEEGNTDTSTLARLPLLLHRACTPPDKTKTTASQDTTTTKDITNLLSRITTKFLTQLHQDHQPKPNTETDTTTAVANNEAPEPEDEHYPGMPTAPFTMAIKKPSKPWAMGWGEEGREGVKHEFLKMGRPLKGEDLMFAGWQVRRLFERRKMEGAWSAHD